MLEIPDIGNLQSHVVAEQNTRLPKEVILKAAERLFGFSNELIEVRQFLHSQLHLFNWQKLFIQSHFSSEEQKQTQLCIRYTHFALNALFIFLRKLIFSLSLYSQIGIEGEGLDQLAESLVGEDALVPNVLFAAMNWVADNTSPEIKNIFDKWIAPMRGERLKRQVC